MLKGWQTMWIEGHGVVTMREGSSWTQPPGILHEVLDYSDDREVVEIIMPAKFDTDRCRQARCVTTFARFDRRRTHVGFAREAGVGAWRQQRHRPRYRQARKGARRQGGDHRAVGSSPLAEAKAALGEVDAWIGDITREEDTAQAFARLGAVDHVFLAGGGAVFGRIVEVAQSELERIVQERIWAVVYVARAAAKHMSTGSITLMSGAIGSRVSPGSAMKHAVLCATEGLARGLALELAPLRVNAIAPGIYAVPGIRKPPR
jgi:hypothetical protein